MLSEFLWLYGNTRAFSMTGSLNVNVSVVPGPGGSVCLASLYDLFSMKFHKPWQCLHDTGWFLLSTLLPFSARSKGVFVGPNLSLQKLLSFPWGGLQNLLFPPSMMLHKLFTAYVAASSCEMFPKNFVKISAEYLMAIAIVSECGLVGPHFNQRSPPAE